MLKISVNILLLLNYVHGYNILGIFSYPAKSHYTVFDPLMVELANRGHSVTVYNTFPKDYQILNYREVDIKKCFSLPDVLTVGQMVDFGGALALPKAFSNFMPKKHEIFDCRPLVQLANSTEKYDVLITETFFQDFFQFFGYHLKTPVITFHSNTPLPWMSDQLALPDNPSYIPHSYEDFPAKMTFVQRLQNTVYYLMSLILYKYQSEAVCDEFARDFFGPSIPPLKEVVKNVSLLFLYTHFSFNGARPLVPRVVEVAGLNFKPAKRLPEVRTFVANYLVN